MLVGLIWAIQILAYPQFLRVAPADFVRFHFGHCWRVGLLISPLLLVEFASAVRLLVLGHRELPFQISAALISVNWLSTMFLQAPLHWKLMEGFDASVVRRLIQTNWVRTTAWTLRGVLVALMVAG